MKKNNKGFTLMEMLIVVAIIGVLVAIAVPTINKSLTKAKQAADNANVRSILAEANSDYLLEEKEITKETKVSAAWDKTTMFGNAFQKSELDTWTGEGTVKVTVKEGTNGATSVSFTFTAGSGSN